MFITMGVLESWKDGGNGIVPRVQKKYIKMCKIPLKTTLEMQGEVI